MQKLTQEQHTNIRTKLLMAIERLNTGILYGEDMATSTQLTVDDAIRLLDDARLLHEMYTKEQE